MDVKTNYVVNDHNKPTKFEGFHFKRWRQNVLFFLTTKKIATNNTPKMHHSLINPLLNNSSCMKHGLTMIFFARNTS